MSIGLTARQGDCLSFMRSYRIKHGHMPSYTEIAASLNFRSKSGVHRLMNGLVERGAIRRLTGRARAIEIIDPKICPHCGKQTGPNTGP